MHVRLSRACESGRVTVRANSSKVGRLWLADERAGGGGGKKLPPMWKTLPAHLSSAARRHYLNERKTIREGSKSFYFIHN